MFDESISEFGRLKEDLRHIRQHGSVKAELLEVAFLSLAMYRLLRMWRVSPLDIRPLRYLCEKMVEAFTHIHLPTGLNAKGGLRVIHGYGLIVNAKCILGADVTLYARVTLGVRFPGDECPVLGDNVSIGTGACVFGPVTIPANSRIPANAVLHPGNFAQSACGSNGAKPTKS